MPAGISLPGTATSLGDRDATVASLTGDRAGADPGSAARNTPSSGGMLLAPDLRQLAIGRHDLDREALAVPGGAEAVGLARAAVGLDVLEAKAGNDAAGLVAAYRPLPRLGGVGAAGRHVIAVGAKRRGRGFRLLGCHRLRTIRPRAGLGLDRRIDGRVGPGRLVGMALARRAADRRRLGVGILIMARRRVSGRRRGRREKPPGDTVVMAIIAVEPVAVLGRAFGRDKAEHQRRTPCNRQ